LLATGQSKYADHMAVACPALAGEYTSALIVTVRRHVRPRRLSQARNAEMDIGNIAELNTFLVLAAIRSRGHVTRRQLGYDLGLSDASISRIVKRLLAAGLIAEEPGTGAVRGRIPAMLRFIGPPGAVIAVD